MRMQAGLSRNWRVVIAAGLCALAGCQASYFMMGKEPKKTVGAEFGKLEGKTTAIVVWCDQATLDTDAKARFRVADTVRYYMQRDIKKAKFANVREITEYQEQSGSDWEGLTNVELGKRFKADYVIRIDLVEYTARARDAREVLKGRVRATISVYDVEHAGGDRPVYTTEVAATYPQDGRTDTLNATDLDVINGALRSFGEKVSQKFFEHEEAY